MIIPRVIMNALITYLNLNEIVPIHKLVIRIVKILADLDIA